MFPHVGQHVFNKVQRGLLAKYIPKGCVSQPNRYRCTIRQHTSEKALQGQEPKGPTRTRLFGPTSPPPPANCASGCPARNSGPARSSPHSRKSRATHCPVPSTPSG